MILSVVPKKMKKVVVVSLLALAGVAMLSNSSSDLGHQMQRGLTADSTSASSGRSESVVNTVHELAAPFLEDQANIFAFDGNDPRPVINTFFAIPEGQKIKKVDAEILAVWKRAWSSAGWNPVSLQPVLSIRI